MCQPLMFLSVCCSLMSLVIYGHDLSSNVIFSDSKDPRYHIGPWVLDNERPYIRTTRQNNRRPISSRPQTTTSSTEDPFDGLDPVLNNQGTSNNNRPFNGNQMGSNGDNQEQSFQGNNGNRPLMNQNSWGSSGTNNEEQSFQSINGNNRPSSNLNRPSTNQNQNQNRPNNNQNRPNNNQNQNRPNNIQNQNQPNNNQNQNQFNNNQNQFNNNQNQNQSNNNQNQNRPNNNQNQNQFNNNQNQNRPNNNQNQNRPNNNQNQNQFNNNQNQLNNNQNQNQEQTSTSVSETLRQSCNSDCKERILSEYNPVCGSDSMTYQNRRFLECVASCGIPTQFSYVGTCVTTTERIVRA